MLIKKAMIAAAIGAVCVSRVVMADEASVQFTVEAEVPTAAFHVTPVANWAGDVQRMGWNVANEDFEPIEKPLDMKSTIGEIKAHLVYDPILVDGANSFPLLVKVADVVMGVGAAAAATVLDQPTALVGKRVGLEISAIKPTTGFVAGTYQGDVHMLFESVP